MKLIIVLLFSFSSIVSAGVFNPAIQKHGEIGVFISMGILAGKQITSEAQRRSQDFLGKLISKARTIPQVIAELMLARQQLKNQAYVEQLEEELNELSEGTLPELSPEISDLSAKELEAPKQKVFVPGIRTFGETPVKEKKSSAASASEKTPSELSRKMTFDDEEDESDLLLVSRYSELEAIAAVGDKITKATPVGGALIDENGIFHIMYDKRSGTKFLTYSRDSETDGAICATPKNGFFEIEYGKHPDSSEQGLGKKLVGWLCEFSAQMDLQPARFYAEVSSASAEELNMGSYLTLLGVGFIPIERNGGDGIRFVHPCSPLIAQSKILSQIMSAYAQYLENKRVGLQALMDAIKNAQCTQSQQEHL